VSIHDYGDPHIEWEEANAANEDGQAVLDAERETETDPERDAHERAVAGAVLLSTQVAAATRAVCDLKDCINGTRLSHSDRDVFGAGPDDYVMKEMTQARRDAEMALIRLRRVARDHEAEAREQLAQLEAAVDTAILEAGHA